MSDIEKVSVALTRELAERVRAAVQSGDYASSSEVIRDALGTGPRSPRGTRSAPAALGRRLGQRCGRRRVRPHGRGNQRRRATAAGRAPGATTISLPVLRTNKAETDLDEIWLWIAEDNIKAAEDTIERIEAAENRLGQFPELGQARPDLSEGVRHWPVGSYLILYRIEADHVLIVRVIHGARDLPALFRPKLAHERLRRRGLAGDRQQGVGHGRGDHRRARLADRRWAGSTRARCRSPPSGPREWRSTR